tara:strand:- start:513 stop:1034 length:522 start_codon:yes stop_codon:yes gene_type:complete
MNVQSLIAITALSLTSSLSSAQESSIYTHWHKLANEAGAELLVGDYPYAAWYSQQSFEDKEWEGYWFAHPVKKKGMKLSIYIPESESIESQAFSFFHELGHVTDDNNGKTFDTTWDNEVSAWSTGRKLMMINQPNFSQSNMKDGLTGSLSTYLKGLPDDQIKWNRALKEIFSN